MAPGGDWDTSLSFPTGQHLDDKLAMVALIFGPLLHSDFSLLGVVGRAGLLGRISGHISSSSNTKLRG